MENRHTSYDLAQMQALPLSAKIKMSKQRIRDWYDYWNGEVYVGFSGGKDSTVLKHLVETTVGDVPSLFVNTGLEYPEIQRFALSQPNVISVRPSMRFDEVIKTYGYPVASKEVAKRIYELNNYNLSDEYRDKLLHGGSGCDQYKKIPEKWKKLIDAPFKVSHKCCDVMKKAPAKKYEKETGKHIIIGTMAEESLMRKASWVKYGCNAFDLKAQPQCRPLSFWTENDILLYIKEYKLPYCSLYGDIIETDNQLDLFGNNVPKLETTGAKRTGCVFCMFGMGQDGCVNRFQKMKSSHPVQYEYCMRDLEDGGLGIRKVLEYIGEEYE